jgi:hypothetical protein
MYTESKRKAAAGGVTMGGGGGGGSGAVAAGGARRASMAKGACSAVVFRSHEYTLIYTCACVHACAYVFTQPSCR